MSKGGQSSLDQRLAELRSAYSQKAALFADNHPDMRALLQVIAAVEKEIAAANARIASEPPLSIDDPALGFDVRLIAEKISMVDQAIETAKKRQIELASSVEELQKLVVATSGVGANLQSMERKRAVLQARSDDITITLSRRGLANAWRKTSRPSGSR